MTTATGYLELLAFPDPDLNLGDVSKARSAEQGHLLHLCQGVGVLGVDLFVVHSLCRIVWLIRDG